MLEYRLHAAVPFWDVAQVGAEKVDVALNFVGNDVAGIFGLDAPLDMRDIGAGIADPDLGVVIQSTVGLLPVVGGLKYADEVVEVAKRSPLSSLRDLPELPAGYHYRRAGGRVDVVRNPGRADDLQPLHIDDAGDLALGSRPGTFRNASTRAAFLRQLDPERYPRWMRPYLQEGRTPPGFEVDHFRALFDEGEDAISNMRLLAIDLHRIRHRFYRPGGRIPSLASGGN